LDVAEWLTEDESPDPPLLPDEWLTEMGIDPNDFKDIPAPAQSEEAKALADLGQQKSGVVRADAKEKAAPKAQASRPKASSSETEPRRLPQMANQASQNQPAVSRLRPAAVPSGDSEFAGDSDGEETYDGATVKSARFGTTETIDESEEALEEQEEKTAWRR
jgi:hypothetical protein